MKRSLTWVVAPALFAAMSALPALAQNYDVTNLGLGGGTQNLKIVGINANGQVAGSGPTANGQYHAFFASPTTGVIDIGTLGDYYSEAIAINGSGQVVGNWLTPNDIATWRAFSWTKDGGLVDLGSFNGRFTFAVDVNDAGTVIGIAQDGDGLFHAFGWNSVRCMYDLGGIADAENFAVAINGPGASVGYSVKNGLSGGETWDADGRISGFGLRPDRSPSAGWRSTMPARSSGK